jgi:hypothetical protein
MSDLRFTDTNASDDSAGRAFGLEGNLYLPLVAGVVVGIALFGLLGFAGVRYSVAGTVALVPIAGLILWLIGLRHGKPSGYDRDKVEAILGQTALTLVPPGVTLGKSHAHAPEGRFVQGFLLFGSPEQGGLAAKGFRLEPADLRGASIDRLNAVQDQLRGLLALIGPGCRVQFQWTCDSDYRAELLRYHEKTQTLASEPVRRVRNERFARFWRRMQARELRRERLTLFLSIEITAYAGNLRLSDGLTRHYDALFRELAGQFEEFAGTVRTILGNETSVSPLTEEEHCACVHRFLNPGVGSPRA